MVEFYHVADDYLYNLFYVEIINSTGALLNATDIYAPDDIKKFVFSVSETGNYFIIVTGCQSGIICDTQDINKYTIKTNN